MADRSSLALWRHFLPTIVAAVSGYVSCPSAVAGDCTVPGSHASIQAAIDDAGCTSIEIFDQSYSELLSIGRSLSLSGPPGGSAQLVGQMAVAGNPVEVMVSDLAVTSGCEAGALRVTAGAHVAGFGLHVVYDPGAECLAGFIFADGFED